MAYWKVGQRLCLCWKASRHCDDEFEAALLLQARGLKGWPDSMPSDWTNQSLVLAVGHGLEMLHHCPQWMASPTVVEFDVAFVAGKHSHRRSE